MTRPLTLAALLLTAGLVPLVLTACVSQRASVDTAARWRAAAPYIEQAAIVLARSAAALERMATDLDRVVASVRVYPSLRDSVADYPSISSQLRSVSADMHRAADGLRSPRAARALTPAALRKLAAAARQASVDGRTGLVGMGEAATAARRQIRAANVPTDVAADLEQAVVDIDSAINEGATALDDMNEAANNLDLAAEAWEGAPSVPSSPPVVAMSGAEGPPAPGDWPSERT